MEPVKYIHEEAVHNHVSPKEIVPVIVQLISPASVVDIGCGIGDFLHFFKKAHIPSVLGIDGPWVNKDLLYKNISPSEFQEENLEEKITLHKKYDLVVSIEVAEHIAPEYADTFIENLVNAGDVILFSAAVPNQGGQNHVNEQNLSYWADKFTKHGYVVHDVLKPFFWNNHAIYFWYKQNMVLVTHKSNSNFNHLPHNTLENCIHNEMFDFRIKMLEHEINLFRSGRLPQTTYIKYFLKSLFSKKTIAK